MSRVGTNITTLLTLYILIYSAMSGAATRYAPALDWFTLHSEHFNVHFHTGEEAWARVALATAERAHAKLTPEMGWTPLDKTDIVLADKFDLSNGATQVFPSLHVELYMVLPVNLELIDNGDWFEKLITHEYAHIIHLDMARGRVRGARNTFGRLPIFFPNMFQPLWGIEGIATFYETDKEKKIGRGQSSMFRMMMRAEVMAGLKPLYQINQDVSAWPGGTVRYLYGVEFFKFVEARYGREKIEQWMREYSDNIIPFFVNYNTRQVLGKRLTALWPEFEAWEKETHNKDIAEIENKGVVSGRPVTKKGGDTAYPRALPDGRLYYIREDNATAPALMEVQPSGTDLTLTKLHTSSSFDVHATSGFIISQLELCNNVNVYFDLYGLPLAGGTPTRLTQCARLRDPAWHPQGDAMVAVKVDGLRNALVLLNKSGRQEKILWQGQTGELIHRPAWSADGQRIAAALWRSGQGVQIEEFSLASNTWQAITQGGALHFHPAYSANGDLYYSADEDGTFNVYRRSAASAETEQMTRVLTGAFMPAIARNGEIFYQGYTGKGYDIYRLPGATAVQKALVREVKATPASPQISNDSAQVTPYSALAGLRPHVWFPHLSFGTGGTELGMLTSGADPLRRHGYFVDLAYDIRYELPVGMVSYQYDRYNPMVRIDSQLIDQAYGKDLQHLELRRHAQIQADMLWRWRQVNQIFQINWEVSALDNYSIKQYNVSPKAGYEELITGVNTNFNTLVAYPLSHAPESGYSLNASIEGVRRREGGITTESSSMGVDYSLFVPVGSGGNLSINVAGHGNFKGDPTLSLGGISYASNAFFPHDKKFWLGQRSFPLKGYESINIDYFGDRLAQAGIVWRTPLIFIERGLMTPPISLQKLYGAFYVDGGRLWNSRDNTQSTLGSAGAEVNISTHLFYSFFPMLIKAGYAYHYPAKTADPYVSVLLAATF